MKTTADTIRSLGFEWPRHPEIEKSAVTDALQIDLDATLARLESQHAFYDREIGQMQAFARQWNARMEDITDNRETYGAARVGLAEAIRHVKAIRLALEKASP